MKLVCEMCNRIAPAHYDSGDKCVCGGYFYEPRNLAKPEASHAVLDEGWRDANIYLPKSREIVWLYCKTRVMGILFQTSGYWTIGTSWYEYNGDGLELNVEVIAWRPLPDPPAFV